MKNLIDKEISTQTVTCTTEYHALNRVMVVPPVNMEIKHAINKTQEHYLEMNINKRKALEQHANFLDTLTENKCEVVHLQPKKNLNEQVFTRDIGFVIGETLFVSEMKEKMRKPETAVLTKWLDHQDISYIKMKDASIEGGDVLVDGNTVWIGKSGRTTEKAIQQLQEKLPEYDIHIIPLREDILHLDCVFTILNEDHALLYSPAIDSTSYKRLKSRYNLIEVTDKEQFTMGPNVLSIGENKIISLPENKRLNRKMKQAGFQVVEVEFSEIIKSGGSFRCCTLPLHRG